MICSDQFAWLIPSFYFQVCCHPKKNGRRWRKAWTARTRLVCPGSLGTRGLSLVPLAPFCHQGPHQCLLLRRRRGQGRRTTRSQRGRGETSRPSPGRSRSLSPTCPSAGSICSNMPSFQMTAPTDVLSVKRSRYLRASRTSTASSDMRSSTTRASPAKCSRARCAPRSSRGRTRWNSTWNKSTTVLSPSLKPLLLPPPLISSSILSSALATPWPSMPSLVDWRTLRTTCTSWSARWPATLLTSRAQEGRGRADLWLSLASLSHNIFGNHGGPRRHLAKFKISIKKAFSNLGKLDLINHHRPLTRVIYMIQTLQWIY